MCACVHLSTHAHGRGVRLPPKPPAQARRTRLIAPAAQVIPGVVGETCLRRYGVTVDQCRIRIVGVNGGALVRAPAAEWARQSPRLAQRPYVWPQGSHIGPVTNWDQWDVRRGGQKCYKILTRPQALCVTSGPLLANFRLESSPIPGPCIF